MENEEITSQEANELFRDASTGRGRRGNRRQSSGGANIVQSHNRTSSSFVRAGTGQSRHIINNAFVRAPRSDPTMTGSGATSAPRSISTARVQQHRQRLSDDARSAQRMHATAYERERDQAYRASLSADDLSRHHAAAAARERERAQDHRAGLSADDLSRHHAAAAARERERAQDHRASLSAEDLSRHQAAAAARERERAQDHREGLSAEDLSRHQAAAAARERERVHHIAESERGAAHREFRTIQRQRLREDSTVRSAEYATNNLRRRLYADTWNNYWRMRLALLDPAQLDPPTADQLIFPERHALAAVMLYHHKSGHQFLDNTNNFMRLRYYQSFLTNIQDC